MDVKEAVAKAKQYASYVFAEENPIGLGLEEVVHDEADRSWNITVGFSRASVGTASTATHAFINALSGTQRIFKVVKVAEADGRLISITNRDS